MEKQKGTLEMNEKKAFGRHGDRLESIFNPREIQLPDTTITTVTLIVWKGEKRNWKTANWKVQRQKYLFQKTAKMYVYFKSTLIFIIKVYI